MLSPDERAEKIFNVVRTEPWGKLLVVEFIVHEIREALEEAHCSCTGRCNTCFSAGRASMREEILKEKGLEWHNGYQCGLEEAAKIVQGEIEVYEEKSIRVTKNQRKKLQKKWLKLKDILKRICTISVEGK